MNSDYNKLKVFFDLITFRVKYKELKMASEISEVYDTIFKEHKPITIEHFKIIKKYKFKDFKRTVEIHNRYIINSNEKIKFTDLASTFRTIAVGYLQKNPATPNFIHLKSIMASFDDEMKNIK
jgi:hypothetical protein